MESAITTESIAIIVIALAVGSFAKAITGIGLPPIAIPIMAGFLGMERTVVILVIPTMASNAWLVWEYRKHASLNRDLPIVLLTGMVGVALGTWALSELDDQVMFLLLAVWTWVYLLLAHFKPELKLPEWVQRPIAPVVGVAAGILQGATGVSGPIVATYFHALRLSKEAYVFSVTLSFLVLSGWQVIALVPMGMFTQSRFYEGLLALIPTLVVMPLGIYLARVMSARVFNMALFGVLFLISLRLFYRGLVGG